MTPRRNRQVGLTEDEAHAIRGYATVVAGYLDVAALPTVTETMKTRCLEAAASAARQLVERLRPRRRAP